jgi:hypothetical protein
MIYYRVTNLSRSQRIILEILAKPKKCICILSSSMQLKEHWWGCRLSELPLTGELRTGKLPAKCDVDLK